MNKNTLTIDGLTGKIVRAKKGDVTLADFERELKKVTGNEAFEIIECDPSN